MSAHEWGLVMLIAPAIAEPLIVRKAARKIAIRIQRI